MGNTYEVYGWQWSVENRSGEYIEIYRGESIIEAIKAMRKAKKSYGCIKLEWR